MQECRGGGKLCPRQQHKVPAQLPALPTLLLRAWDHPTPQIWSFPVTIELVKPEGRAAARRSRKLFLLGCFPSWRVRNRAQVEPLGILFAVIPCWPHGIALCSGGNIESKPLFVPVSALRALSLFPKPPEIQDIPHSQRSPSRNHSPHCSSEEDFILHPSWGGKDELLPIPAQQDPASSLLGGLELAKSQQQLQVPIMMAPKLWQCQVDWPQRRVLPATVLGLWNPKCGFGDPKVRVCRPQSWGL